MMNAWTALFASRKFWIGTLSVVSVIGAVVLVAMGKVDKDHLVPTITAISAIGVTLIGSIAWEDSAQKRNEGTSTAPRGAVPETSDESDSMQESRRSPHPEKGK
jgi:hypothetical protein